MKELNELLLERAEKLKKIAKKCSDYVKTAPEGVLHAYIDRGHPRYHLRASRKGGRNRYLGKKDIKFTASLAQRDYCAQVLKVAQEELKRIEALIAARAELLAEDCFETLSAARKVLVKPVTMTNEEYAIYWQSEKYVGKPFRPDDTSEFYSIKGERMRSKSEVIIANILYALGIPYKYEHPLELADGTVIYPDFTILNVRTREVFILEHLGKMGDQKYASDNITRLNMLIMNGFFIGVNLLISMESDEHPLDTKALQTMIEHFLM
ncbi:MAG: hypothetical protein IIU36_02865 [Firmicutes bacterium]|nr:hypothetical protein [Bacillota bacterium]